MDEQLQSQIQDLVKSSKVFLFMKGEPGAPQCGFSAQAANILEHHGAAFKSFNVLENEAIRQGIKEFSDWPTIPQLYINGEFIGGCDIMTEMHHNGDLKKLLSE